MRHFCLIAAAIAGLPCAGLASSEEAWEEFRAQVRAACLALVEAPEDAEIGIEVNPFGSDHYGAAIVSVTPAGGAAERMICIRAKTGGAAELTAPFAAPDGQ